MINHWSQETQSAQGIESVWAAPISVTAPAPPPYFTLFLQRTEMLEGITDSSMSLKQTLGDSKEREALKKATTGCKELNMTESD